MSEITINQTVKKITASNTVNEVTVSVSRPTIQVSAVGPQGPVGNASWGAITGTLSNQLDLKAEQDAQDAAITANAGNITTIQGEQVTQDAAIALNTNKRSYPIADETKLGTVETGAEVNTIDAGDNISLLVNDVGYITNGNIPSNTDELTEGVANLYYTESRVSANTAVSLNTAKRSYPLVDETKLSGIEAGAEVNNISDLNATDLTDAGDSSLHFHSSDRNRANHTGTQTASTISDFDTGVSNNTNVAANTLKLAGIESGAEVNTIDAGDNVSLLANDAGYITSIPASYLESGDNVSELVNDTGYQVAGGAGMLSNTTVTVATGTSVNISAGTGFISTNNADGTVSNTEVSWNASTESIPAAILAVDQAFYITKDSTGTTQFYAFPIDETVISVEIAIVSAGVISGSILTIGAGNFGAKNQMTEQTLAELFLNIGPALEGVEIVPDAADLSFDVSAGAEFFGGNNWRVDRQNPNHFQFAGLTNPVFIYAYQDPAEANGWTSFASGVIDPDQWDDGSGTLASVPNSEKVTIQPLWISVTTGTVIAQLGQQTYRDLATALAALPTAAEMAVPAVADLPRLGWLVTTKGQTILADATYIKQLNKGTNISPSAAVKMQDAYNNTDGEPEILTDSIHGSVAFQRGSAADTDSVFEVQNGAGSMTFSVDGNGNVTANNLQNLTDTDDLPEGATNLYYTEARVSANTDVALNTAKVGVTNEPSSDPSGVTGADAITNMMSLTQAEYDAIGTPNASTFYIITDAV